MATSRVSPVWGAAFFALTALLAACGGGGGSGSGGGGGGVVPPGPTNTPPTVAPPTATPFATGQMTVGGTALSTVAFTCGCTQDAGKLTADGSGNYSITVPATSWLGDPKGYTPPGHNLMVIGYATFPSHVQSWTMEFYGNSQPTDQNLDGSAGANVADKYTTAAALFVYYQTEQYYIKNPPTNNDNTYDIWNFNDIKALKARFAGSSPSAADTNLLNAITSAQGSNTSLYPAVPSWDKSSGDAQNINIVNLIKAVISSDTGLPQPCGTSCTGTPTP